MGVGAHISEKFIQQPCITDKAILDKLYFVTIAKYYISKLMSIYKIELGILLFKAVIVLLQRRNCFQVSHNQYDFKLNVLISFLSLFLLTAKK